MLGDGRVRTKLISQAEKCTCVNDGCSDVSEILPEYRIAILISRVLGNHPQLNTCMTCEESHVHAVLTSRKQYPKPLNFQPSKGSEVWRVEQHMHLGPDKATRSPKPTRQTCHSLRGCSARLYG
jgi:hypothetical protein